MVPKFCTLDFRTVCDGLHEFGPAPWSYGHQGHDLLAKPRHQLGKDGAERRSAGRDEAPNRGEAPGRAVAPNSRRLSEAAIAYERERSAPQHCPCIFPIKYSR